MNKPIYMLGAGGHASVLADMLQENGNEIAFIYSPKVNNDRNIFSEISIIAEDGELLKKDANEFTLVNGIGSLPDNMLRKQLFCKFFDLGYFFEQVISKHAVISTFAVLGNGVQVMHGVIIQAGVVIGDNTIVNTGAIIDHDCIIGEHNHIAPGATLSGQVVTGNNVHIGTGAIIIQGVSIGDDTVIAAGAIITKNIKNEKIVFGARCNIQNKKV